MPMGYPPPLVWTKLENFKHISQLSMPDLLFQPPSSESNYARIHFQPKFFQTRACKTSNKMEICNFFQICSSFSHLPAHSGAKIWASDEISRIKIHPKWSLAGFRVFPTIGGRYQMGMNLDSHIGECYARLLSSVPQSNAKPNVSEWTPTTTSAAFPLFTKSRNFSIGFVLSASHCARWDEAST